MGGIAISTFFFLRIRGLGLGLGFRPSLDALVLNTLQDVQNALALGLIHDVRLALSELAQSSNPARADQIHLVLRQEALKEEANRLHSSEPTNPGQVGRGRAGMDLRGM